MPDPVPAPGEVVVDIVAASVNLARLESARRASGHLAHFPYILGRDFSGVVSALGDGVGDLRVGDEMFGSCDVGQEGAYAENRDQGCHRRQRSPSACRVDAAALALDRIDGDCTVEDCIEAEGRRNHLIQGGCAGVSQLCDPVGETSGVLHRVDHDRKSANHDYLRAIGADEIVDYNAVDFTTVVKDCDVVFDTVGRRRATIAMRC